MSIRRWFNGILRPDEIETDKATVNGKTTTDTLEANQVNIDGYYTDGEIQPVAAFGIGADRRITTTEDTFGNAGGFNQLQLFLNWSDILPGDATTYVFTGVQLDFNQEAHYQIYNNTNGEVVGDTIGPATGNNSTGWVQYEPTTTNGTIELFPRLRADKQGEEVNANSPTFMIGIER